MSDPKAGIEAALYSLLDGTCSYTVYNTEARGTEYIVFQAAGGSDEWWHGKMPGFIYEYEILGVSADRNAALTMAQEITDAMRTATELAPAGFGLVAVTRTRPVDYTQATEAGEYFHHVGGIYEIEVEVDGD